MIVDVYINTWGRYNEGLEGAWFELGNQDSEELGEMIANKIEDNDPELFIQDTDTSLEGIEEHTDIFELNEVLYELDDYNDALFNGICELESIEEAIRQTENNFERCVFLSGIDEYYELGEYCFEDTDIPDNLVMYIDYESKGEDFDIDMVGGFVTGGYLYFL